MKKTDDDVIINSKNNNNNNGGDTSNNSQRENRKSETVLVPAAGVAKACKGVEENGCRSKSKIHRPIEIRGDI